MIDLTNYLMGWIDYSWQFYWWMDFKKEAYFDWLNSVLWFCLFFWTIWKFVEWLFEKEFIVLLALLFMELAILRNIFYILNIILWTNLLIKSNAISESILPSIASLRNQLNCFLWFHETKRLWCYYIYQKIRS